MPFLAAGFTNPTAPTTVTSPDGILTATVDGPGVLLKADFSSLSPTPQKVQFTRSPDILVRSGDDAWASAGVAYAYDMESPLGSASSWVAYPVAADGTVGAASQGVAVSLPAPVLGTVWLKSTADADLSIEVATVSPLPTITWQARQFLSSVEGVQLPAGGYDVSVKQPLQYHIRTDDLDTLNDLYELLGSGVVLIQHDPHDGIPDYFGLPGDITENYVSTSRMPSRTVDVTFQPVKRPSPLGAWISVPNNTVADLLNNVATVGGLPAAYPTVGSLVEAQ